MLQDLRYGFRMLGRRPGFTMVAVLALALGIGANTAVFSVIRSVLLRELPYAEPDRLVVLWESNVRAAAPREATSPPNFKDWREQSGSFEDMAAMTGSQVILTGEGEAEYLIGGAVTANYFDLLGAKAAVGRAFSGGEAEKNVVLLSDALWSRRFGRDRGIVGRSIRMSGVAQTVAGVMPADFRDPNVDGIAAREFWRPLHAADLASDRRSDFLRVFGRLKRGVTVEQARAEMTALVARLAREYPAQNSAWTLELVRLDRAIAGNVRRPLWLLLASAAVLLLIACANVANLFLARSAERHREFAIRTALGGGARRLLRQLLTESLALGLIGGAAGWLLGVVALRAMLKIGGEFLPRAREIHMDWTVMLFAFTAACITAILFGALPAKQAARIELNESLRRNIGAPRGRARSALAVAEISLTLVLLAATGLLLRSFWRVQQVPLGFESSHVLTASVRLPGGAKDQGATIRFLSELLERVEKAPGVSAAGAISAAPLTGHGHNAFGIEGRPAPSADTIQDAILSSVTPGYFRAMGIGLQRGRFLSPADTATAPKVAMISEGLARRYFANEDPLGHRISFDGVNFYTIAGVAADVHDDGSTVTPMPQVYLPHAQFPVPRMVLEVRTRVEPAAVVSAIRGELKAMNSDLPLYNVKTMDTLLDESFAPRRFALSLIGVFAGLALLVAAIGIYGVIAYSVTERTQEFGVRMALGAMRGDVLKMVLWRGLKIAALGIGIGAAAALAATRVLASFLFGVTSHDPVTFSIVTCLFIAVTLAACMAPALRATRVDPMIALRYE